MSLKMLFDGALAAGIDGNKWFLSNGDCLGSPTARFIFSDTLLECKNHWNYKYSKPSDFVSLHGYEDYHNLSAQDFLSDDASGFWL